MAEIIEMPKLSDTMTTGTLIKWLKKEGDAISAGDMVAEVETDKATMEVEVFEDGHILKLYAAEGDSVAIGDPICAIGEKGESAPDVGGKTSKGKAKEDKEPSKEKEGKEAEPEEEEKPDQDKSKSDSTKSTQSTKSTESTTDSKSDSSDTEDSDSGDRIRISPLARAIAKEKGLDISLIKGTGPAGRIVKDDVLKAAENPPKAPAAAASGTGSAASYAPAIEAKEIPVTNMRLAIAKALVGSKTQAPHFYLQMEVDGKPLANLRAALNEKLSELSPEQGGVKFTVNDLILKAAAEAVRRVPQINRSWMGDKIVQHGGVQLAFGVAIDDGLLTPVIRDAHAKTLRQIAAEAKELIGKARNRKLKPDEMSGSTLTVTNLGMFGISDFYGIINPPNAAILSVGATVKTPVVDDNDQITIGYRMKVGLSGDHRVIDGAVGAQYLAALREILETPALMLV